ncbi:MAG: hypothetical protein U1A04_07595, partial [Moraxellaceae bacterium]|nr:hypothetical protein [Moraxellaceae bacterium]
KSRVGTVVLAARQEGDHIAIEVREDGAGMDPEALHEKSADLYARLWQITTRHLSDHGLSTEHFALNP